MTNLINTHVDLFGGQYLEAIQALVWKQPFGTAMLNGKIAETRTWKTEHRGKVLMIIGKSEYSPNELDAICHDWQIRELKKMIAEDPTGSLGGYAFAVGVLKECRPMLPEDEKIAFVKFNPHLYSHIYHDVQRIHPFPLSGSQRWKNITDQKILEKIKYA